MITKKATENKKLFFFNKKNLTFFFILFLLSAWLMHTDGDKVSGDGQRYFILCRNLFFHQDLLVHQDAANASNPVFQEMAQNGRLKTPFSIGPAITWMPFYSLAHGLFIIGHDTAPDGYEYIYRFMISIGTILAVCAAFLILFRLMRAWGIPDRFALLSILVSYLGTSLINYTVLEASMSHGLSFFAITLFIYSWWQYRTAPSLLKALLMGLALGYAFDVRWVNVLWGVIPIIDHILYPGHSVRIREVFYYGFGAIIGGLPQFLAWRAMHGSFIVIPQGESFMVWTDPRWLELLFSHNHGLLSFQIVVPIGLTVVLFTLFRKVKAVGITVLILCVANLFVNSVTWDWNAGHSFGARRFDSFFPLVAIGLALLFHQLENKKRLLRIIAIIMILGVSINLSALYLYKKNPGLRMDTLSPKRIASTLFDFSGSLLHLPVNLINSIRWGVLPGQAELLLGNTPRFLDDSFFIHHARHGEYFLNGWSEEDYFVQNQPYRKLRLDSGRIGFPLIRRHQIKCVDIAFYSDNSVNASVTINGQQTHTFPVSGAIEERITLSENEMHKGFNEILIKNNTPGTVLSLAWLRLVPDS